MGGGGGWSFDVVPDSVGCRKVKGCGFESKEEPSKPLSNQPHCGLTGAVHF